jgi:PST family polysaccharide transporter
VTTLRHVAANGGWWLVERSGALLLALVTSVVVVRALGPAQFGELSYLLAITGLLTPLAQFGVSGLVARALLEQPGDERAVLRAAMRLRLAGCAMAFAVGLAYWLVLDRSTADRWLLLVLLAAQFATVAQVVEFWFQVRFKAARLVPWRTGAAVVAAVLKMATALSTRDARWVALVFAFEFLLSGAAAWLAFRRASGTGHARAPGTAAAPAAGAVAVPASDWMRWYTRRSPWLLASGIAEVIYLRIDIVLLERLRGVHEAGIYAVAARLSEVWYMVPVALMGAAFPALWARRADTAAYQRGLQSSLDLLFALAFVLAVLTQLFGRPLVEWLFGTRFGASVVVLQIHIWAGMFVFMRALLSRWLLAEDLLRFSLLTHVCGAVVNVGLNLLLIPRYGATGAAVATVIAYAAAGWLSLYLSPRTRPMGHMMARALLLPLRWSDLAAYARRARLEWSRQGASG